MCIETIAAWSYGYLKYAFHAFWLMWFKGGRKTKIISILFYVDFLIFLINQDEIDVANFNNVSCAETILHLCLFGVHAIFDVCFGHIFKAKSKIGNIEVILGHRCAAVCKSRLKSCNSFTFDLHHWLDGRKEDGKKARKESKTELVWRFQLIWNKHSWGKLKRSQPFF